jgi:hypothetical protein
MPSSGMLHHVALVLGVTSQKTAFFIFTAMKAPNLTIYKVGRQVGLVSIAIRLLGEQEQDILLPAGVLCNVV